MRSRYYLIAVLVGLLLLFASAALADSATTAPLPAELGQPAPPSSQLLAQTTDAAPAAGDTTYESGVSGYFDQWFVRSDAAKASQPHWMTPLVTVTPRLEQEVRYDQYWETRGNGSTLDIHDSGMGLELIPTYTNEVLINPPAYQFKQNTAHPANGWLDDQFLIVKQRLLSANEQDGNYIVTAFLGVTAPSGNAAFTNGAWIVTPTIAGGKGWGDFDIQATRGLRSPTRTNPPWAPRWRRMLRFNITSLSTSGRNSRLTTPNGWTATKRGAKIRFC
jgi:hypothetical protein